MRNTCLLLLLFTATLYARAQSSKAAKEDKIENKVGDLIAGLPEVMKADTYCRKKTHGKRHLVTWVARDPSVGDNYYLAKVIEDNGVAYHTWYDFKVSSKTFKIFYVDYLTGKNIPLNVWRKKKNYLGLN